MSHVSKIELEIKDLDALHAACQALGLELVRGQKTYRWYGRSVGDYPLPDGFTANELGKCEHAIRIPGNNHAYEIGVVRSHTGNGYTLLWDFWNRGYGMEDKVGKNACKLRQQYQAQVTIQHYQRKGFRVTTSQKEDGRLILTAMR